MVNR
jgi:hypothetical protein